MKFKMLKAVIAAVLVPLLAACTTLGTTPVAPISQGYVRLVDGIAYRQIVTPAPNPRVTQVVEVDLTRGDFEFRLTRGDPSGGKEYMSQTTSTFTRGTGAIVGVNAGFFGPVVESENVAMDAAGFVVADGHVTSPPLVPAQDSAVVRAVVCFEIKAVLIDDTQSCPANFKEGLAAGPRLLRDGVLVPDPDNTTRHPRTALGVSLTGDKVWLVVTDGRQPDFSEGATLGEMAELLASLGAVNAINLDGGGSSALVYSDPQTGPRTLNRPIQSGVPGKERPVATHIGVFLVPK
jgi:Phosphodiester glycosidase